ncbi:MAG: DUF5715 family protein [Bacteroidales bacterium]|nr:DUF5715 family protein [Bacteroidales bacterium]
MIKRIFIAACVALFIGVYTGCSCSDKTVEKKEIQIKHFGNFRKVFNDLNDKHLEAAKKNGVPKVISRKDAEKHKRQLVELKSSDLYKLDNLDYSIPFLVPKANDLLEKIAGNFQDSLRSKGVDSFEIVVTSVLRSEDDVKKLRRKNTNASQNSAHRYGTTFDIAYARYNRINNDYPHDIPVEHLKHILGEVLRDLRKEKKCYVKYEINQGCFHITAR